MFSAEMTKLIALCKSPIIEMHKLKKIVRNKEKKTCLLRCWFVCDDHGADMFLALSATKLCAEDCSLRCARDAIGMCYAPRAWMVTCP